MALAGNPAVGRILTRSWRVPIRLGGQALRVREGQHLRRPVICGDVIEVDEQLNLLEFACGGGHEQRVEQVVPVKVLVVVRGPCEFCPRLG